MDFTTHKPVKIITGRNCIAEHASLLAQCGKRALIVSGRNGADKSGAFADMAAALETGRPGRTTSRQTYHVLEVMAGILESAATGTPVEIESRFEREAPMDPTLPVGSL